MTNEQKPADIGELVKRLLDKADMIEMGERIAWGSDSAIMREAAQELSDQEKAIVGIDEERVGSREGCIERNKQINLLEAQLAEAKAEIERMTPKFVAYEYLVSPAGREMLQDFAKWAIREGAFQAADLDGLSIQEKAHELGLIEPTTYDPEKHGPSDCAEPGDEYFVFTSVLTDISMRPNPLEPTIAFVARMCWRADPPNANNPFTESERFSAIKYHPTVTQYGREHAALEADHG